LKRLSLRRRRPGVIGGGAPYARRRGRCRRQGRHQRRRRQGWHQRRRV